MTFFPAALVPEQAFGGGKQHREDESPSQRLGPGNESDRFKSYLCSLVNILELP
jgi:hypothetical protein